MQFIVRVRDVDAAGQVVIKKQTVVYTDTKLEAKVSGAAQLGVDQDDVVVTVLGDTGLAPNTRIIGTQGRITSGR